MRTIIPIIAATLLFSGCVTTGHDPVVVQAERVTELAVDMFDAFLVWEYSNQEALSGTPEVKAMADTIRANGVQWLTTARIMTRAYKQNRTKDNEANLETALEVLQTAMSEAAKYWQSHPNP